MLSCSGVSVISKQSPRENSGKTTIEPKMASSHTYTISVWQQTYGTGKYDHWYTNQCSSYQICPPANYTLLIWTLLDMELQQLTRSKVSKTTYRSSCLIGFGSCICYRPAMIRRYTFHKPRCLMDLVVAIWWFSQTVHTRPLIFRQG